MKRKILRPKVSFKRFLQKSILSLWNFGGRCLDSYEQKTSLKDHFDISIALVKNPYFFDLYQTTKSRGHFDLISSSLKRSGPVGLFTEFNADFIIVDVYPEFDGQKYRERLHQIPDAEFDEYMQLAQNLKKSSLPATEVNWSKYDLVIALDNAVPASITQKYSNVVWATMLENHKMPSFRHYLSKPPIGYDLFFTQHFGPNLRQLKYGKHVVDWPYGFSKTGTVAKIFDEELDRNGMTVESHGKHLWKGAEEELMLPIRVQGGHKSCYTITDILKMLLSSRYFCSVEPKRPLWGNALIEAAAAGCLLIADPNWHWNSHIILPELRVSNIAQAKQKIHDLEKNTDWRHKLILKQNKQLDWYAFNRPLDQLRKSILSISRKTRLSKIFSNS